MVHELCGLQCVSGINCTVDFCTWRSKRPAGGMSLTVISIFLSAFALCLHCGQCASSLPREVSRAVLRPSPADFHGHTLSNIQRTDQRSLQGKCL